MTTPPHALEFTDAVACVLVVGHLAAAHAHCESASARPPPPSPLEATEEELMKVFVDVETQLFIQLPERSDNYRAETAGGEDPNDGNGDDEGQRGRVEEHRVRAIREIEEQVLGANGWDREGFDAAFDKMFAEYKDDEAFQLIRQQPKEMLNRFFPLAPVSPEMTPESVLGAFREVCEVFRLALAKTLEDAEGKEVTDLQEFMETSEFHVHGEELIAERPQIHVDSDITLMVLIRKYFHEDADFRDKAIAMRMKLENEIQSSIAELGIKLGLPEQAEELPAATSTAPTDAE